MTKDLDRLHKVIANAGYCSRRKAEKLIANGQVKVNEKVITDLGTKVKNTDFITINNEVLNFQRYLYFAFYKPINCITTVSDPKNRPTVMQYFNKVKERIYPIGRLDFDTTGLLLFTNNGSFSHAIMHPKFKINKVYQVTCKGLLSEFQLNFLQQGVRIETDFITSPAKVEVLSVNKHKNETIINLTIAEGHKNQVKRMLLAVGSKVLALKRVSIGNITLAKLVPGQYRPLTRNEINTIIDLSNEQKIND